MVGTLLGFMAGAYLPLGLLSPTMVNVLNVLPFSPAAMLLRDPLGGDALGRLTVVFTTLGAWRIGRTIR